MRLYFLLTSVNHLHLCVVKKYNHQCNLHYQVFINLNMKWFSLSRLKWEKFCAHTSSYITLLRDSSMRRFRSCSCKSFSNFSMINAANRGGSVSAKLRSFGSLSVLCEQKKYNRWKIRDILRGPVFKFLEIWHFYHYLFSE
jgi:hypothetical protein